MPISGTELSARPKAGNEIAGSVDRISSSDLETIVKTFDLVVSITTQTHLIRHLRSVGLAREAVGQHWLTEC